ncbi:MAG: GHKL domain-containing protein [Lachnospiraceae bacterium]|nr:GHKL domain-containing protein [Lachnospiraceae bacterium]
MISNLTTEDKFNNPLLNTTKKDKANHGIGISNIKEVVNKYGGECYYEFLMQNENPVFRIKVCVRIAERI